MICRNESGELSSECLGDKPTETEPCHSKCTRVFNHVSNPMGWEKVNNSSDDFLPEEHTIVIQDEYNDEIEEDDDSFDDKDFDASENLKSIVGTNPK